MGFNEVALGLAIVIGVAAGLIGRARPQVDAIAIMLALAVGGGASMLTLLGVVIVRFDGFAAIHVAYLICVVGVPIAAALLLTRRATSRWITATLAFALLAAPVGVYATYIEPFWLRVDRVEVVADGVDGAIRFGVLSDLQSTGIGDYERTAIDRLIDQRPDVVLVPGDFWQIERRTAERIEEFRSAMQRLDEAVPHVIAVNGNSDTVEDLGLITKGTDVVVLDDEIVTIDVDGTTVIVLGITLFGSDVRSYAATRRFAEAGGDFRLVLAHQPDEIGRFDADDDVDLLVAGHTHGGQVSVPFFGPPLTLSSVPRSVAAGGLHRLDGIDIYVSTGVGRERGSAPQMRFGVRPSIGVIDVVPG